ncbi:MAG TPA: divergent polysaccharide deacetylase family protein [Patescibacteria group bacterium]|nr:divergent polysaccharide deacetylase family protein [Patescibacteria group bacterium]
MRILVNGVVVPFTLFALAAAGWYIATGETPMELLDSITTAPRVEMPMPPRPGPEKPSASLIRPPPPANDPDIKMSMGPVAEPKPPAPPAASEIPSSEAPKPDAAAPTSGAPTAGPTVTSPPPPPAMSEPLVPPGGEPLAPPSFALLPPRDDLKALMGTAPLPDLVRSTANGPLPIIAGGKEPRVAYARPFDGDKTQPRIGVVVVGLGLSKEATEAAITKLPPEVSLSFSPYTGNLDNWIKRARASGHEVLIDLPMEPPNFPMRDAGPLSLLSHQSPADAIKALEAILGKTTSYVGVAGALRSPVVASEQWVPLLHALRNRGLLFVGDGLVGVAESDVPASGSVTLIADETPFRAAIDARLGRLLAAAQRDGSAIAYISPRPVSFERLLAWTATFPQKGLVLAPVSAVVHSQP